jgi:hypothetical protein
MAKQTANEAYGMRRREVEVLLQFFAIELDHHAEYAKVNGPRWTHVGDVLTARKSIIEALAQLAQQDEAFIEKRLIEALKRRK